MQTRFAVRSIAPIHRKFLVLSTLLSAGFASWPLAAAAQLAGPTPQPAPVPLQLAKQTGQQAGQTGQGVTVAAPQLVAKAAPTPQPAPLPLPANQAEVPAPQQWAIHAQATCIPMFAARFPLPVSRGRKA